jgi:hypothetical protein
MNQVTFQAGSPRSRQARWRHRLGATSVPIGWALLAILTVGGSWLWWRGNDLGWTVIGVTLIGLMFQLYNSWWLRPLPVSASIQDPGVSLDQVLEASLLGGLTWPTAPTQLWQAATRQWQGVFIVNRLGIPVDLVAQLLDQDHSVDVWGGAMELARANHYEEIDAGVVVATILTKTAALETILTHLHLDDEDVINVMLWQHRMGEALRDLSRKPVFGGIGRDWASGYTPLLNRFARNLTREIEYGYYRHLPQVHESVVDQLESYLAGNRGNVALLGEVGSGKTSIVYSLAERLLKGDAEGHLEYYYVMQLNAAVLCYE